MMNLTRIIKYTAIGLIIGTCFSYLVLILLAFMFGSDSMGNVWRSINLVLKNGKWILEKPFYIILFGLIGLIIGAIKKEPKSDFSRRIKV